MFISTAVSKVNSALLSINAGEGMILSIRLKYSTDKRVNLSSHSVGRNKCILDASVRIIFHFSIPNRLDKHIFIRVNRLDNIDRNYEWDMAGYFTGAETLYETRHSLRYGTGQDWLFQILNRGDN